MDQGGEPVAFAAYAANHAECDQFRLQKLDCRPETQGKGYGRILVEAVGQIAVNVGAAYLILNVHRANPAIKIYEKIGFEIIREETNSIGPF